MGTHSGSRRPAGRRQARRNQESDSKGTARSLWIGAGALVIGLLVLGLLRTGVQSPPEPTTAETVEGAVERAVNATENHPPVVKSVKLIPDSPDSSSRIAVVVDASDADGDAIRYDVAWYRNGVKIKAPPLQVFPEGVARRGDRIRAEVVATDGFHKMAPRRTAAVLVRNLPPSFPQRGLVL